MHELKWGFMYYNHSLSSTICLQHELNLTRQQWGITLPLYLLMAMSVSELKVNIVCSTYYFILVYTILLMHDLAA